MSSDFMKYCLVEVLVVMVIVAVATLCRKVNTNYKGEIKWSDFVIQEVGLLVIAVVIALATPNFLNRGFLDTLMTLDEETRRELASAYLGTVRSFRIGATVCNVLMQALVAFACLCKDPVPPGPPPMPRDC